MVRYIHVFIISNTSYLLSNLRFPLSSYHLYFYHNYLYFNHNNFNELNGITKLNMHCHSITTINYEMIQLEIVDESENREFLSKNS